MIEPRIVKEFSSERIFDLSDAVRPNLLLFRNYGGSFNPVTTDLIFAGVLYMEIPSILFGIRITIPCDEKAIEIEKNHTTFQCVADEYKGELVYAIESEGKRFHVVASTLWIHIHTLPSDQSTLFTFDGDGNSELRKVYYSDHLKEWYKLEPVGSLAQ